MYSTKQSKKNPNPSNGLAPALLELEKNSNKSIKSLRWFLSAKAKTNDKSQSSTV